MNEDELLAFVRDAVRSVWALELLILLQQDDAKAWRAAELVVALRANTRVVTESLATLGAAGLVRTEDADVYRYGPASEALAETVRQIADLYTRKPMAMVKAVLSAPTDKIQTFADAFRFRK